MRIIFKNNGVFLVQSGTYPKNFYEVDLKYETDGICQCKSFKKSNVWCKHIQAVKDRIEDNMIGVEGLS